jgi:hypothetical protein
MRAGGSAEGPAQSSGLLLGLSDELTAPQAPAPELPGPLAGANRGGEKRALRNFSGRAITRSSPRRRRWPGQAGPLQTENCKLNLYDTG